MKNLRAFVLCFFPIMLAGLAAEGCKKDPPVVPEPTLSLTALDASCTEAWLKATTTSLPTTIRLVRLTPTLQTLQTLQLTTLDSLLIDEGLLPRHTYTYQLQKLAADSTVVETSPNAQLTTLDTTSHNFTFQIDTLGDGGGSVLLDVAIINDTLAYAVGEIYKRDSVGNWDPLPYNLVKWNGQQWELKRITVAFRGSTVTVPLEGIFAHSPTDIWVAGSIPIHGNGTHWVGYDIQTLVGAGATVSKAWGTSSNMYFVGRAGNIIHYDGTRWRRVESGTGLSVYDIFGSRNAVSEATEVLAIASNVFQNQGAKLLRIQGSGVVEMPATGLTWGVNALWFSAGKRYYVVGPGIHQKRALQDSLWSRYPPGQVTSYFSEAVRGVDVNDLFVTGSFREVVHFNGVSWRKYFSLSPGSSGGFGSIAVQGNLVVLVGSQSPHALVAIGRRN